MYSGKYNLFTHSPKWGGSEVNRDEFILGKVRLKVRSLRSDWRYRVINKLLITCSLTFLASLGLGEYSYDL